MGLFDKRDTPKKKKDDFDSPVEQIDLSAPAPAPEPMAAASGSVASAPEPEPEPEPQSPPSRYGINDAIELMRALPPDNVELVVQVVKRTLESTNVKVSTIIEDASSKQKRIEDRIAVLKGEIADFEKEIETRGDEIGTLEADHDETSTVKERLLLAEKLVTPGSAKKPAANGPGSASKTSEKSVSASGTMSSRSSAPLPGVDRSTPSKTTIVAKK